MVILLVEATKTFRNHLFSSLSVLVFNKTIGKFNEMSKIMCLFYQLLYYSVIIRFAVINSILSEGILIVVGIERELEKHSFII